ERHWIPAFAGTTIVFESCRSYGCPPVMPNASALIDAFCDQVWLQDGLAASSLGSYRRDLMGGGRSGGGEQTKTSQSLLAADRGDIEAFLAAQVQAGAKPSSMNRRLSSLRRFYRLQLLLGTL